jgi:hypothetical protein
MLRRGPWIQVYMDPGAPWQSMPGKATQTGHACMPTRHIRLPMTMRATADVVKLPLCSTAQQGLPHCAALHSSLVFTSELQEVTPGDMPSEGGEEAEVTSRAMGGSSD